MRKDELQVCVKHKAGYFWALSVNTDPTKIREGSLLIVWLRQKGETPNRIQEITPGAMQALC